MCTRVDNNHVYAVYEQGRVARRRLVYLPYY